MAATLVCPPVKFPAAMFPDAIFPAAIFPDGALPGSTMRLRDVIVVVAKGLREGRRGQQRDHAEYQPPHARQSVVCRDQHRRNGLTSR
jgi:hypothetical protein